jgi:threonine dehydratase
VYSRTLSRELESDVYVKLENLNPTHSFKVRGGIYYMAMMHDRAKGFVTASMGNHAQSMAYAGGLYGADVKVVMPDWVSPVKKQAVEELGADIITYGSYYDESAAYAKKLADEQGLVYVDPINERLLYPRASRQCTSRSLKKLPDVQLVINPLGGGSGSHRPRSTVYKTIKAVNQGIRRSGRGGPQPFTSHMCRESSFSTEGVKNKGRGSSGLQGAYPTPFELLRGRLDGVVLVSDEGDGEGCCEAFSMPFRQVAELAGAAPPPRQLTSWASKNLKTVVMLTGSNIQPSQLAENPFKTYITALANGSTTGC